MEKNEIKKALYKENPMAVLHNVRKDGLFYTTGFGATLVSFLIPLGEIGEVIWEARMPAKLLIRWIQE